MEVFKRYQNVSEVDRFMVVDLIRQINVYEGGKVEVVFRHSDETGKVMKLLENLPDDFRRQQAV